MKKVTKQLKNEKVPGPRGVYTELLKNVTENLAHKFTKYINGKEITEYRKTVYIRKKANKLNSDNY